MKIQPDGEKTIIERVKTSFCPRDLILFFFFFLVPHGLFCIADVTWAMRKDGSLCRL
jgi:hypothetical protein